MKQLRTPNSELQPFWDIIRATSGSLNEKDITIKEKVYVLCITSSFSGLPGLCIFYLSEQFLLLYGESQWSYFDRVL